MTEQMPEKKNGKKVNHWAGREGKVFLIGLSSGPMRVRIDAVVGEELVCTSLADHGKIVGTQKYIDVPKDSVVVICIQSIQWYREKKDEGTP